MTTTGIPVAGRVTQVGKAEGLAMYASKLNDVPPHSWRAQESAGGVRRLDKSEKTADELGGSPSLGLHVRPRSLSTARGRRVAALLVCCLLWHAGVCSPAWGVLGPTEEELALIGVTDLINRLGPAAPTGAGVAVSHIEEASYVSEDGVVFEYAYTPNTELGFFSGREFTLKSGPSVPTNHATNMGAHWYGDNGIAPGVTDIHVYSSESYWADELLRSDSSLLPLVEVHRVQNHGWNIPVGSASTSFAIDVLRRFDFMLDRDGVVAVVGAANRSDSVFPLLMANSYNSIAVGQSDAWSSLGPTNLDTPGRSKPDIVTPAPHVSNSIAWLSAAATLLINTAGSNTAAAQPETIKAALLAGATKDEFDLTGATTATLDDWSHSPAQPLDLRFGAGELNVDNSHRILTAGEFEGGGADIGTSGWDFDTIAANDRRLYYLDVPPAATIKSLSIITTWHREFDVDTSGSAAVLDPRLANIDLRLYEAVGSVLGTMVDQSVSSVDNVEHVFQQNLPGGRYAIELVSDQSWDFALAWQAILDVPGDANGDGKVDGLDYLVWAGNFGDDPAGDPPGSPENGDFNDDGVVNGLDYLLWAGNFGQGPNDGMAVPEAEALAPLIMGAVMLLSFRRRRGE